MLLTVLRADNKEILNLIAALQKTKNFQIILKSFKIVVENEKNTEPACLQNVMIASNFPLLDGL